MRNYWLFLAIVVAFFIFAAATPKVMPPNVYPQLGGQPWEMQQPCTQNQPISAVAANTQLIAAVAGQTIRVCSFEIFANAAAAPSLQAGTGAACATGTVALTGTFTLPIATQIFNSGPSFRLPAGTALCVFTAASVSGFVNYAQY